MRLIRSYVLLTVFFGLFAGCAAIRPGSEPGAPSPIGPGPAGTIGGVPDTPPKVTGGGCNKSASCPRADPDRHH